MKGVTRYLLLPSQDIYYYLKVKPASVVRENKKNAEKKTKKKVRLPLKTKLPTHLKIPLKKRKEKLLYEKKIKREKRAKILFCPIPKKVRQKSFRLP